MLGRRLSTVRGRRDGVMLLMSTLVITFVGGVGILGIYALSLSTAISVRVTGIATSAAFAASSAVDLEQTGQNASGAPILNPVAARDLAVATTTKGIASNNLTGSAELVSVNVYNVRVSEDDARRSDPNCNSGNNALQPGLPLGNFNVYPNNDTVPDITCWLSVTFRGGLSTAVPGINPGQTRGCPAFGPSYGNQGYPNYYLRCTMHFTSGVATTIRYRVMPCPGGATIPFCSNTYAYASGYADYTYKDT